MLSIFSKVLDQLERVEKALIAAFSVIMIVSITYQVIMRYVFSNSNAWSEELARYLLMYVVVFGATIAIRKGGHLQVDFLLNILKPRNKCIMTIFCTLAGILFLGYFLVTSIQLTMSTTGSISAGLNISMAYVYAAIPIGSVLMILVSIELIFKQMKEIQEINYKEVAIK